MSPRISLIISLHNRAKYISAAIKSVLNQTRGDFELIVRDDGSTDDSLAIAQAAARGDARGRVVVGKNVGPALGINQTAALASAPYFGWIDSDDMLAENALRETAAVLDARPEIGMVYTDHLRIDERGVVKGPGRHCKTPYSKDRLLTDFMTFHFRLMRRELFDQAGQLDDSMRFAEDYDLCLKLSEITQIHHVQKPLYMYRVHPDSISQRSRDEQVQASARAVRSALTRRGLDREYELDVEVKEARAQFRIRKKRGS